jgi:arylsulfatase A-like enzyme
MSGEPRAVVVICDSLRPDLITPRDAPFLCELAGRAAIFANHRSVFPSTTRTSAATIATGCRPARHGLFGNTMALDEGDGLVCRSVGHPDFRDRLRRATGRTLHVPTLAERLCWHGEATIVFSNVSPGAAYFLDPDGYGWVYHPAGSYGPGNRPLDDPQSRALAKGAAGDAAMTERFCAEILGERAPSLAVLWLSEPDYSGHHHPLGSPAHRAAIAAADACVRRVADTVRRLDPDGSRILLVVGSDHGMETVGETIDLDAALVEAGFKESAGSGDVVVAPNGTAATVYFAAAALDRVAPVAGFLRRQRWAGQVLTGDALAGAGLPAEGALRLALSFAADDRVNPYGIAGGSAVVRDPLEPKDATGFGQHGGLGAHEQHPFLLVAGGGFAPGRRAAPTALIDLAPSVLRHLRMDHDDMDGTALPLLA